jgi:outer membrane lipoprotein
MKRFLWLVLACMLLVSCATVVRQDLLDSSVRQFSFADLLSTPDSFKGKTFLLGGTIINRKVTDKSTLVEVLYIPVDRWGYPMEIQRSSDRFIAFQPKEKGILDEKTFRRDRDVTVAGVFVQTISVTSDDNKKYDAAVFKIEDIYLWEEKSPLVGGVRGLPSIYPWEFPQTDREKAWRYYAPNWW